MKYKIYLIHFKTSLQHYTNNFNENHQNVLMLSFQSSFCSQIVKHCEVINRVVHVVNLDPAADYFDYPVYAGMLHILCHVKSG